jgi:hypothetical protein
MGLPCCGGHAFPSGWTTAALGACGILIRYPFGWAASAPWRSGSYAREHEYGFVYVVALFVEFGEHFGDVHGSSQCRMGWVLMEKKTAIYDGGSSGAASVLFM